MITNKDLRVLRTLQRLAINADPVAGAKVASAISYKNMILAVSSNRRKSHPFQARFGKNEQAIFLHAETGAIKLALNHIDKTQFPRTTLYVQRVKKLNSGSVVWQNGIACPCQGCMMAIEEFDIGRIVYSTNNDNEYAELVRA